MLNVSVSRLRTLQCPRKYRFKYVENISPRSKPLPLYLGKIMHEAFDLWYKGHTDSDVLNYITTTYTVEITKAELSMQEDLIIDKWTAVGMWASYPWKDRKEFTEAESEKEFNITIGNLRNVRFRGIVDGLVQKDGTWWVRELKTTGMAVSQFYGRMKLSEQGTGYVYAMQKLGHNVAGIMFEGIKRPLIRKRVGDTAESYGMRIVGMYKDDAKLSEQDRKYYVRYFSYRNPVEIRQFIEYVEAKVRDIRYKSRTDDWYREYSQCWNYNSLCGYASICHVERPDELTLELNFESRKDGE